MRRFRPPPPKSFLGGRELRRLISMIAMLAILWMLFTRAADPRMWKFFAQAPEDKPQAAAENEFKAEHKPKAEQKSPGEVAQAAATASPAAQANSDQANSDQANSDQANSDQANSDQASPAGKPADVLSWETVTPEPGVEGPLDEDSEERDAAKEQFQAVSDFEPLNAVDMPAYWRLMRWSQSDSFVDMKKRAKRGGVDVFFTHLAQEPEKHRGELVQLRLHLVRSLSFEAPENSAGVKRVYEVWGTTENDSRSNPYVLVFSQKPPQLPMGADISEEATFVGYFLKDMSYEAYNVKRWAPLLIGRLRWQENEARSMLAAQRQNSGYVWPVLGIGTLALAVMVGSWIWRMKHPKKRRSAASAPDDEHKVEAWIERAEQGEIVDPSAESGSSEPGHRAVSGALDWLDPTRHNETS